GTPELVAQKDRARKGAKAHRKNTEGVSRNSAKRLRYCDAVIPPATAPRLISGLRLRRFRQAHDERTIQFCGKLSQTRRTSEFSGATDTPHAVSPRQTTSRCVDAHRA